MTTCMPVCFVFRPQMMHNVNVVMMQLAMLMAPPPVTLSHLPYAVLFGCSYAIFSWVWFHRTGMFYYFFLDYRPATRVVCLSRAVCHAFGLLHCTGQKINY